VKFGDFVNFSGKYHNNSGILLIFRAKNNENSGIFKIYHTHFSGKNVVPP